MNILRRKIARRFGAGPYPMTTAEFSGLIARGYSAADSYEFDATNGAPMWVWDKAVEIRRRTDDLLTRLHADPSCAQRLADEYGTVDCRPVVITDAAGTSTHPGTTTMPLLVGQASHYDVQDVVDR